MDLCSNFYFKDRCCSFLKFYFAVSGAKSVVLLWCSASICFKVQFRKSTSPYKASRVAQSGMIMYFSNFKCSFAFFSLFSLQHCGFGIPLMLPLKTRDTCSLCPSVNETDTTLLFDININL